MTPDYAIAPCATPAFETPLRLGQHNLPAWDRYEAAMRGIFERRYYTNQGPLTRDFEARLQAFLNVRHVVCVTNATIGLMMASEALGVSGRALVPGMVNPALEHALAWCGVEAVFYDVEAGTAQPDLAQLEAVAAREPFDAIVGANLWGGACDRGALELFAASRGVPLLFDSLQAFGSVAAGQRVGSRGPIEVLSFDAVDMLNAAGGACVTTNDDELAARLRNIRSSYGAGRPVSVVKTSNGRMSEAQAALGLLSLEDFERNQARNQAIFEIYRASLNGTAGLRVVEPARVEVSNHQSLVCAVDESTAGISRDALVAHLASHNVDARPVRAAQGLLAVSALPASAAIAASWMLLPIGAHVSERAALAVCDLIGQAQFASPRMQGAVA
ncbi:DegT/DnrJ/EryC1/StrS family aminotransferase [Paraburkholderia kururiensis]|uniref:DegT/DnrJ/EryC1/StrS family aminotransferase n=1 Tax=Paraburkholderia kururiensis TaxID=984307 RepID=UPI0005A9EDCF|nr:DegT/DnrJ/EryC1/StrS family aminotransferase [Paraburkholderia kururiensis]